MRFGATLLRLSMLATLALVGCHADQQDAPAPTYTLGGTVSDLNTSGLVLADNGHTLAVSAGATGFSFGAVLTPHSSYAVTVQTQPTGQTCSVTDGTGPAGSANIANVVVVCSEQAYRLGGTISGLTTTGLVLANGADTLSVAAHATSFTMPTPVATGSSYAVTVQTQPLGLACAVNQGSSVMPPGNVTAVAVSCSAQPLSLGGSISGLTASGLVLANGTDTLTVAANATNFTMPTAVPYASAYAVTVQMQPIGLTCTVSNGADTMPAAAVTNVAVTCGPQTYALGGSISGLTASGLVLANAADTLVVDSGATSFVLPTALPAGSAYAVTVQTQPTGLTCAVSAGAGTMPAAAVNVSVTCAITTYTLGGTIAGLTGSGLVLANGTDLTPALGATATVFTLPTGVATGASYDVTVHTQPSGQLCTVADGSSAMGTSDVSTVAVSCGSNVVSFTNEGPYTWTVPDGVSSIQVVATGGGGGGSARYGGGNGGVVTATMSVTAGDSLSFYVGGGGGGLNNAGGGGGSTDINGGTGNQIIAGGGGGGGYGSGGPATGGDGGGSGTGNASNGGNSGGGGGGSAGSGGTAGVAMQMDIAGDLGGSGNGGPGGAGDEGGGSGGAGGSGSGAGTGGTGSTAGGGGGGGGYGGGGGAAGGPDDDGGGGGGGSAGPSGAIFSIGSNAGAAGGSGADGSIVITTIP